jgi:rod shape determining protein RodA
MKLLVILVFARILSEASEFRVRSVAFLSVLAIIPIGIVLRQPDLGTAAVLGLTILCMLGAARLPKKYWLALALIVVVSAPLAFSNLEPYQRTRVETFLTPAKDPFGAGYNVIQSIIAVGNGGVFGQGIGQGTQSQLEFLPVAHTDFIFAGIAEASGLVGSSLVIILLAGLCIRALLIAQRSVDRFGLFLAIGIGSLWLVQFSINIAMNLGLAPVTGIPLPFVSHGGSALVMNCIALGLLQSIAIRSHSRKIRVA